MNRAEEYFNMLGIDLDAEILKLLKYFPITFFERIEIKELEVTVQKNSDSNWALLPFYNWEILSFRNGYQEKSTTQDIIFTEPVLEEVAVTEYTDFWFVHYGDRFLIQRLDEVYKVNIVYNYCEKSIANLKELPKIEIQNLLMNLMTRTQDQAFKGIERFKLLYSNLIMENTIRPEVKVQNQLLGGFYL